MYKKKYEKMKSDTLENLAKQTKFLTCEVQNGDVHKLPKMQSLLK